MYLPDTPDEEWLDVAISLCELLDEFGRIEAVLLSASSEDHPVTPASLANASEISERTADDVLLQLRRVGAVSQRPGPDKEYSISVNTLRPLLSLARVTQQILGQYEERQPPRHEIDPLVTFPEDPSFEGVTPQDFGMGWLMPSLTGMIGRAESRIVLLTPFLERDGFERISGSLEQALVGGVEVVIVSRYLHIADSHNRKVLEGFVDNFCDSDASLANLHFVDYTVWPAGVSPADYDQPGVNPSFTLHSKLLLVDDREVYIGSANMTEYGLSQYLETGIRVEGPTVASYRRLVDRLIDSEAAEKWFPRGK